MYNTIIRKRIPILVFEIDVADLDKSRCSHKFLSHNLPDDTVVNVRCHEDGTIDFRGKKQQYRIILED